MGADVKFVVNCKHVATIKHTFQTSTPWKELKELKRQGYEVTHSSETCATLEKVETLETPKFYFYERLSRLEGIQFLFQAQYPNYKPWCKWNFENCCTLRDSKEFESTLKVWDEIWDDVFIILREYEEREKEYPWNSTYDINLAKDIRTTVRNILQYALDHEGIQVETSIHIDY